MHPTKKKKGDGQETKASSQYKKTTPQRSLYKDFFFLKREFQLMAFAYDNIRKSLHKGHFTMIFFFEREFQLMAFAPDNSSLSSDQDTN